MFAPEHIALDKGTRNLSRLAAAHRKGLSQWHRELPAMREFLGRTERTEVSGAGNRLASERGIIMCNRVGR